MGRIRLIGTLGFLAAIIVCWTFLRTSAQEKEKPVPGEQVLIGPFQVDELYKSRKSDRLETIAKDGGPSVDNMLNAMKGWRFYVLDRKVKEKDRWVWDRPENRAESEYPKMLLEGFPTSTLKDKNGKEFPFNMQFWKYNYSLFQGSNKELARMDIMFRIGINMPEMRTTLGEGVTAIGSSLLVSTGGIRYDVTGKYEFLKSEK
jgi:hypothetical protein